MLNYAEALTATDTSTLIEAGNDLTGQFQRSVTGTITNGALIETGTDRGTLFSRPSTVSTSYAVSESGNPVDGSLSLSESGTDRYALLEQSNNTSNAVTGNGPGNVDYSPVGAPLTIAQGPAAPTGGGAYPGEQSPTAAQQDPFAQQGLDLLHEYCFPAGTLVLTQAGPKPIEQIQPGEMVLSVDDRNPDGPAEWKPVEQVYHNAPAELLNVHVSLAAFPPLGSGGQGGSRGIAPGPHSTVDPTTDAPSQILRPTFNHPFYVVGKGWTSAANLEIGDNLRTPHGDTVAVTDLFANRDIEPVFNMRVAGNHTYFVGIGNDDFVLVHNTSTGATRFWGAVKGVGGTLQALGGVVFAAATAETGVGIFAGLAVGGKGLDNAQAGFRQMWSGEETDTATKTLVVKATGSQTAGAIVDLGTDLASLPLNPTNAAKPFAVSASGMQAVRVTNNGYRAVEAVGVITVTEKEVRAIQTAGKLGTAAVAGVKLGETWNLATAGEGAGKTGRSSEGGDAAFPVATGGAAGEKLTLRPGRLGNSRMSEMEALDNGLSLRDPQYLTRGLNEFEKHHPLMEGATFRDFWRQRGFSDTEVKEFMVAMDKDIHRGISEARPGKGPWWDEQLLGRIMKEEGRLERKLTKHEVVGIAKDLLDDVDRWSPKPD